MTTTFISSTIENKTAGKPIAVGLILVGLLLMPCHHATAHARGSIERVSVSSAGGEADALSRFQDISADGRFVVFASEASNLVSGDNNGKSDIFLRDRSTGKTTRISVAANGTDSNNESDLPMISDNGRYVAFFSTASNLLAHDSNNAGDAFVYDRITQKLARIVTANGQQINGNTYPADISADGRFISFASEGDNVVSGDTNHWRDVFVLDSAEGTIERVSIAADGAEADRGSSRAALISDDGRYVAYYSQSTNLVADDSNDAIDVFVRDRLRNTTTRVSVDSNGRQANGDSYFPSMSSDGRFIAFTSGATNLVAEDSNQHLDIFLHDRLTHRTTLITDNADGDSYFPEISADGRFIGYDSNAGNLVAADKNGSGYDVFVFDRKTGKTSLASIGGLGIAGNSDSWFIGHKMSSDGRYLAYSAEVDNLVDNDNNAVSDSFVRDLWLLPNKVADLSLQQSVSPNIIKKGQQAEYTLTIYNTGPDIASNVTLTNILPTQASLAAVSASQGRCSRGKTVICRLGKLDAGRNAKITLTVRADSVGKLRNQAHVAGDPQDPKSRNNGNTAIITVNAVN